MLTIVKATFTDREEIFSFFEQHGLVENAWAMMFCQYTFHAMANQYYNGDVLLCRDGAVLAGVARICDYSHIPPFDRQGYDNIVLDAIGPKAIDCLLDALPTDESVSFSLLQPAIQVYFDSLPGFTRSASDYYYTISTEDFQPVTEEDVIEVKARDAALFDGNERAFPREFLDQNISLGEKRYYAILRQGKVATCTSCSPISPADREHRVIAIGALETEIPYRRQGLARRLVSYLTRKILDGGHAPIYWTGPENKASQNLAMSLGYRQYALEMCYQRIEKRENRDSHQYSHANLITVPTVSR
ncbi:MAG: GNAT family N-acetyltransferase [Armatimonadota bacterium]